MLLIDWIAFTHKSNNVSKVVNDLLGKDSREFHKLDYGKLGYRERITSEGIEVLSKGAKEMGTHVILSGQACRFFENGNNLLELIFKINSNEAKITRIDLALDLKNLNYDPLEKIIEHVEKGLVVSKWRSNTILVKRETNTAKKIGRTVNFGSRKSEVFLRVYDKKQQSKTDDDNYTRIELEIKGERAEVLQKKINKENAGSILSEILNNYIRFVEQGTCKNKSRWKTSNWWTEIINETKKMQLSKQAEIKDIDEVKFYVMKQASANIATILEFEGEGSEFLNELIETGTKKMKNKHYRIIADSQKNREV